MLQPVNPLLDFSGLPRFGRQLGLRNSGVCFTFVRQFFFFMFGIFLFFLWLGLAHVLGLGGLDQLFQGNSVFVGQQDLQDPQGLASEGKGVLGAGRDDPGPETTRDGVQLVGDAQHRPGGGRR